MSSRDLPQVSWYRADPGLKCRTLRAKTMLSLSMTPAPTDI